MGDIANIPTADGERVPQLGSVAQQSGKWAASNILADIAGKPRKPFHYLDKGMMAMIGRNSAVAEVGTGHHQLHGSIAFAAWMGVHAALMSGFRNRIDAFVDWGWDYFSKSRSSQVLDRSDASRIDWDEDRDGRATDHRPRHRAGIAAERPDHRDLARGDEPWPRAATTTSSSSAAAPGGGTLAHKLAPSGKRILILERGDWLPREPENWDSKAVFVDNRYVPNETWYDEHGKPFQPGVHYWVGGATKLYGAALYRLRPRGLR